MGAALGAAPAARVVFKMHAKVEVSYGAKSLPELPILVLFGWYLAVMLSKDDG